MDGLIKMESLSSSSSSVVKVKLGDQWEAEAAKGSLPWDDGGGYTGIRSITLGYTDNGGVETIQVEYDLFGEFVRGQERGADYMKVWEQRGAAIRKLNFRNAGFPGELVTDVYSYERTGSESGRRIIYDLEFRTNRQRMLFQQLPELLELGSMKRSLVDGGTAGGAIVSFFGRSDGQSLGSIGVYMAATTATGDLLDELHHQGLMPYRTSPLSPH